MICRLFTQKSIHGTNSLCNSRTAVQGDSPASVPQYTRARPKKGWMAGRKLFLHSQQPPKHYSTKVETRLEHILCSKPLVGGQMSVWKRSLASPRLAQCSWQQSQLRCFHWLLRIPLHPTALPAWSGAGRAGRGGGGAVRTTAEGSAGGPRASAL